MFNRYTDHARRTLALANRYAKGWHHEYVGTEHMLLGLIAADGAGAHVLARLGIDSGSVRIEIEKIVRKGPWMLTWGRLPRTPRANQAIIYASEEAGALNQNYIASEHLLLGLIREEHGVAAIVLRSLGVTIDAARQAVMNLLQAAEEPPVGPRG